MIMTLESIVEDLQRTIDDFNELEREAPTAELRSFFHDIVEEEVNHLKELKEKLTAVRVIKE